MKSKKIFLSLFLFLVLSGPELSAQDYLWPTSASKHMSSSFCEYRPAHYHSAIDIKTWNREGYPVFAVDDGRIFKIHISPFGYGKVLYLKLNDGHFAVYAHLKKFIPAIEKEIRREQEKQKRYSITWMPKNWPVKRGELLAYTGQTGIGVPHLHFEIRDPQNHPLNPLMFFKDRIKDSVAPILKELAIIPLSPTSTVNGSHLPQIIPLLKKGDHVYQLQDSLSAQGVIGFALRSYDLADGVYNKFTYYQAHLFLDGKEVFNVSYDTLDFEKTKLADVEIYYPFKVLLHKRFRKLFIEPFNTLPFYHRSPGNGFLRLAGKNHRFRLVVQDYFGNKSIVKGEIQKEIHFTPIVHLLKKVGRFVFLKLTLPSDIQYFSFKIPAGNGHWQPIQYFEILENEFTNKGLHTYFIKADVKDSNCTILRLTFGRYDSKPHSCQMALSAKESPVKLIWYNLGKRFIGLADSFLCIPNLKFTIATAKTKRSLFPDVFRQHLELVLPAPRASQTDLRLKMSDFDACLYDTAFTFFTLFPHKAQKLVFDAGRLKIQTFRNTVYDTLIFSLTKSDTLPEIPGIPLLSPVYSFDWYPQIFQRAANLTVQADSTFADWDKVGVCALDGRSRLHWIGGKGDSTNLSVTAKIKTLNHFVLAADTVAPQIKIKVPKPNATLNELKEIRFSLDDTLSGIGTDRNIALSLDSSFVIPEWDPERKLVIGHLNQTLKAGPHKVSVIVRDRAGNQLKKSLIFIIKKKR